MSMSASKLLSLLLICLSASNVVHALPVVYHRSPPPSTADAPVVPRAIFLRDSINSGNPNADATQPDFSFFEKRDVSNEDASGNTDPLPTQTLDSGEDTIPTDTNHLTPTPRGETDAFGNTDPLPTQTLEALPTNTNNLVPKATPRGLRLEKRDVSN